MVTLDSCSQELGACLQHAVAVNNRKLGMILEGSGDVILNDFQVTGNLHGGAATYSASCFGSQILNDDPYYFRGQITGAGNRIARSGEFVGNGEFGCCPEPVCSALEEIIDVSADSER